MEDCCSQTSSVLGGRVTAAECSGIAAATPRKNSSQNKCGGAFYIQFMLGHFLCLWKNQDRSLPASERQRHGPPCRTIRHIYGREPRGAYKTGATALGACVAQHPEQLLNNRAILKSRANITAP